jgi:1,4-alpha-glucan branching enzyme
VNPNPPPQAEAPLLPEYDLHLFGEGRHWHVYRVLGAHAITHGGAEGTRFAVWAPNADAVAVVGDFNRWNGRAHAMRPHGSTGVWELFVAGVAPGQLYKYELRSRGRVFLKADPYGQQFQLRPDTASVVPHWSNHDWRDAAWIEQRKASDWMHLPCSIYEVHLGSWRRHADGSFLGYRELAATLPAYVKDLGYTHVELMPVMEHPYDPSWGYQCIGSYAPTSRYGAPDDFRFFIDECHRLGLGVILDWVPAHFPKDAHGLARFDGTALYEHEDPRQGLHPDWGTLIYNFGRNQVRNYLLSSAMYWIEEFHADGLRVDAVASMLYLDYSRKHGEWVANRHGGNENLEAIQFLREANGVVLGQHPGTLMIAEESTSWPQVSRPAWSGGLGFSMKWDMGWMHDTLSYLQLDPIARRFHHDKLTFGAMYRHAENFLLPLSHDEVVHGKRSLLGKMPGDAWQRFATLRLLLLYQLTYPGKKLMFMGGELAEVREWNHDAQLDWGLLSDPAHAGIQRLVRDLNLLYTQTAALHRDEFDASGFAWIDCQDAAASLLSYERRGGGGRVLVILNFTPVPRLDYRIGVEAPGAYRELLNSDSSHYGGGNVGNLGELRSSPKPWMHKPHSLPVAVPPLGGIVLAPA